MEQVTIREIAKICGVGVSTVSRAINNHPDINPETKQMILDTIQKHNYVPNNSARNLKRSDSNTIAVLIKGITNPFFADMIRIFEREINKKKYSFVLQHVEENEDEVDVAIQIVKEKRLKGIVFLGGVSNHTDEKLEQLNVPYVISTVDFHDQGENIAAVTVDNIQESEKLVDYLIECGHEKIAILAACREDASIGKMRLQGYRNSLEKHGLPYDEKRVIWSPEGKDVYTIENGYMLAKELLASGETFTCIYAFSDSMAIGACRALYEAGKSVPEDCSVAGFDGLTMAAYFIPSITTIRQPRNEMAEATIKLLFNLIGEKPVERQQIFAAELVKGDSVRKLR